jgi:hypothetical protein
MLSVPGPRVWVTETVLSLSVIWMSGNEFAYYIFLDVLLQGVVRTTQVTGTFLSLRLLDFGIKRTV